MNSSLMPGYLMIGIGGILVAIGGIWGVIIGYYPSDGPVLIGLLAVGALLLWLGQRSTQAAKRREVEQSIALRDSVESTDANH